MPSGPGVLLNAPTLRPHSAAGAARPGQPDAALRCTWPACHHATRSARLFLHQTLAQLREEQPGRAASLDSCSASAAPPWVSLAAGVHGEPGVLHAAHGCIATHLNRGGGRGA